MAKTGNLTDKQREYCRQYVVLNNQTEAYNAAYDSPKGARGSAAKLHTNPNILEYIETLRNEIAERNDLTQDMIIQEYMKIAFANPKDFMHWDVDGEVIFRESDELPDECAAAISEIKFKSRVFKGVGTKKKKSDAVILDVEQGMKFHSKTEALHKLGLHMGMFTEKFEGELKARVVCEVVLGRSNMDLPLPGEEK